MKTGMLTAAALLAALSLAGAGVARADSGTGSQNPDLTVVVSLSPDMASSGDTITETKSVTNNTKHVLDIVLVKTLRTPGGEVYHEEIKDRIAPGKTQSSTRTFKVGSKAKSGDYTLAFIAHDKKGSSFAKATTTVN